MTSISLPPRVALVCDWLTSWGGAERVILELHRLFPEAPLYTSIYDRTNFPQLESAQVVPSFLQGWPGSRRHHPWYYAWMPRAFESVDLRDFDLVVSSSHSCAKGVLTKPETLHVSYCHSPPRYLWDDSHQYVKNYPLPSLLKKTVIPPLLHRLRIWDRAAADRVDRFVANSQYIAQRIQKYYHRPSEVIYPPVEMGSFEPGKREDYFLAVGRLIPYKRFDLIVETFNQLKWPLKIVGVGNQFEALRRRAGPRVELLGAVSEEDLRNLYRKAKGFVFPQVEDFGITAIEAQAYGCPVIAYAAGGALETVQDQKTGVFFKEQSVEALRVALERFEDLSFDPVKIRTHAEQFDRSVFETRLLEFLSRAWEEWTRALAGELPFPR